MERLAPIEVAAAVIRRRGRYLIGRRGSGGSCANLWEFPGGKLEAGETPEQCVVRECREELGVEITPDEPLWRTVHQYPDRQVTLHFLRAELGAGEPEPAVHRELAWAAPGKLAEFPFCPADRALVVRLAAELWLREGALAVRPLRREDEPLLVRWLGDPRVARFYGGRDQFFSRERVRASYFAGDAVARHIVSHEGRSAGYLQLSLLDAEGLASYGCDAAEGTVYGLDLFLGEPELWNRGIGRALLRMVLRELTEQRGAGAVILDPQSDNLRALRCYEACGFRRVKLLPAHELHEGKRRDCWLMEYRG